MAASFQWWQIIYRLALFFGEYHGERGVNHIGDGDFMLIYIVNALLFASTLVALRIFWQSARMWRGFSIVVGASNLLGCLMLIVMHMTGMLVEYGEFIRHFKVAT